MQSALNIGMIGFLYSFLLPKNVLKQIFIAVLQVSLNVLFLITWSIKVCYSATFPCSVSFWMLCKKCKICISCIIFDHELLRWYQTEIYIYINSGWRSFSTSYLLTGVYIAFYMILFLQRCYYQSDRCWYHKVSNISCTLVGNKIVDHSDVVGALPVGAAPTTSSFST